MKEIHFRAMIQELIDENPFAIRAVLKILEIQFTQSVPTLAVTVESKPRLLVNLSFIDAHCHTEKQVKAVIVHEFLHVLLRHTEDKRRMTQARHLAFDAVINAIIHRQYGPDYSAMMSTYYGDATDLKRLLRPMNSREATVYRGGHYAQGRYPQWAHAWDSLYQGKMIADDIESLALQIESSQSAGSSQNGIFDLESGTTGEIGDLLGNHDEIGCELPEKLQDALEECMREMNGCGIWRSPKSRGIGANPYEALFTEKNEPMRRWEKKTMAILKQHLQPDRKSRTTLDEQLEYRIPVLSPGDRRAFIRSLWAPFLPDAAWSTTVKKRAGTAQIYLDVSGSMDAEMPQIIALLGRLSRYIQRPFWAFSNVVSPAVIEKGQLKTNTSGGTSMSCVLEHIAKTKPVSVVVLTDGYIENVDRALIKKTSSTKIHAIVTRDGSPSALHRAGISYTQLDRMPS